VLDERREANMSGIGHERRKRIAVVLYVIAFSFLFVSLYIYAVSTDVQALVLGGMSTLGIALSATSVLLGKAKKKAK
jgi:cytochrome c-type biogenesis protein CcmE